MIIQLCVYCPQICYYFLSEICLLTNAKRVASVRSETYVNVYSLLVDHFNAVLDRYPVMRRTMESIAAERLTKIGQNPSIVSSRADLEDDQKLVNEIVMESTPVVTSASEDEDRDSDDSSCSSKSSKPKKKFKFDFSARLHKIAEERRSRSKESLKDAHDYLQTDRKHGSRMRKVPSGPNLFGLRVPSLPDRRRSGSVGDNLSGVYENELEQDFGNGDEKVAKQRPRFLTGKFFKAFDSRDYKTRKSKEAKHRSYSRDDSPPSDGKTNVQFLRVPPQDSLKKDKHRQSSSDKNSDRTNEHQIQVVAETSHIQSENSSDLDHSYTSLTSPDQKSVSDVDSKPTSEQKFF